MPGAIDDEPPSSQKTKNGKPELVSTASVWPAELISLRESLGEHARALGREAELERDSDLGRRLAEAAGGNGYAAAAAIGKKIYREFSPRTAPRARPWPASLGFWISFLKGEFSGRWSEPRPTSSEPQTGAWACTPDELDALRWVAAEDSDEAARAKAVEYLKAGRLPS